MKCIFIIDVYMVKNNGEKLPILKNVEIEVEHVNCSKWGCLNKIHSKLDELFRTKEVRPNGFEWTD